MFQPRFRFFMLLVGSFVLLHDFRLNTPSSIYRDAILSRPHPYRFGVRPTLLGFGTGGGAATSAGYFASGIGEAGQGVTKFLGVALVEVNFVFTAVECER